jgi:hypothetical protein
MNDNKINIRDDHIVLLKIIPQNVEDRRLRSRYNVVRFLFGVIQTMKSKSKNVIIDRNRLKQLLIREREMFVREHPESSRLFERAKQSMLGGVPMQVKTLLTVQRSHFESNVLCSIDPLND